MITILSFLPLIAHAELRPFGHNISQTDYLPENSCTIGSQVALCSNGKYAIGTLPFLYTSYNMNSLILKTRYSSDEKNTHSLQAAYFKTIPQAKEIFADEFGEIEYTPGYDQEAYWLTYIYSHQFSEVYRMHVNISGQYYINDRQPFSIRRPTLKRHPFQLNITSLHEGQLTDHFGIMGEFGLIHANDIYPRLHTGASLYFRSGSLYLQLGFSMTGTYSAMFEGRITGRSDYQAELQAYEDGFNSPMDEEKIANDFSLHPEAVVQFQF